MEDRLRALVEANQPANRAKWATEWKKQGKKVVGTLCSYVPREIIYAAGMLPWRISGTWRETTPLAGIYRPEITCRYCSHALESILAGELDFLDGAVCTQRDDDFKRLWDVLHYIKKPPFSHIMYLPHVNTRTTLGMWTKSIEELKKVVEEFVGTEITDESLRRAIDACNRTRTLLRKVYDLRKRDVPPLTGAEFLGITTAATVMPCEEFNKELESLIPYLEKRRVTLALVRPRLLVSSDYLDNPAYIKLVEETGCLVAMDDLDTGSRCFWDGIDIATDGVVDALAKCYLNRPACPCMVNWDQQVKQIIEWVGEFRIDGVLELRQLYSHPRDFRFPFLRNKLAEAGIPYISLDREYHLANIGMLRTRIGAFLEMIQGEA